MPPLHVSFVDDLPQLLSRKPGMALLLCSWGSLWKRVNKYKALGSVTGVQEWVAVCGDEMLFKCVMYLTSLVPQGQPCSPFFPSTHAGGEGGMCLT